ncbi:MAG: 3-oxoadipate--succinyl-CoA transferase subunit A [Rhodospirillaceae bacterium]|nr:3-oxoadipate--succinyl-CoA transferase subunit A [Rhodospirillaceae bacterium]
MAEITSLEEAVGGLIGDGDTIAMEGFTHLIPHAAGHQVIRAGKRNLTAIRLTPDLIYDQLIGMNCVFKLIFSWGGNPGVGSLHRFRDAVQKSWPAALEIEEHSHADLANAYVAGASGLPFAVLRGYVGCDLPKVNPVIKTITCPFTGEKLAAVPSLRPDVTIIHAQQADRKGNVMMWGITGVQKEAALAAKRVIVTVEEIVDGFETRANAVLLPRWVVDAVCVEPNAAYPSYALGYYDRDNGFYKAWDEISRDRDAFTAWMKRHVLGTRNFSEFTRSVAAENGEEAAHG